MFNFHPSMISGCDQIKLQLYVLPFKLEQGESTFKPSSLKKYTLFIHTAPCFKKDLRHVECGLFNPDISLLATITLGETLSIVPEAVHVYFKMPFPKTKMPVIEENQN